MLEIRKLYVFLLAVLIGMMSFLPQIAYAATQSRAVQAERTYESLSGALATYLGAGSAGDYTDLNSDDGDTSYMYVSHTASPYVCNEGYPMQTFAEAYLSIQSVSLYIKVRRTVAGNNVSMTPLVRIAATNYGGGANLVSSTSYNTFSGTWNNNPATGTAWTAATINSAEWGWSSTSSPGTGASYMFVTYMYMVVTYTPATVPSMTTSAASGIDIFRATLNGSITDNLSGALDHRGFAYDTVSRAAPGNVAPAASGYANYWTDNSTGFAPGAFAHEIGGLAIDTTYYYRAFAHNPIGWAYGDELSFKTMGAPTIDIVAASNVATTTARLNAQIADDNGNGCRVRFGYDTVSRANVAAYAHITAWTDNYTTGQFPYADIAGLAPNTTYYFRAEADNYAGTDESGELTFTTFSGISAPTNFLAMPSSNSISLSWIQGVGSARTLVRYSTGTFPTTTLTGTLLYFSTGNSVKLEGLSPGTTVYFSAWGENGGAYSAGRAMTLSTTVLYSESTGSNVETPASDSSFMQTPDASGINIPLISGIITDVSTASAVPLNYLWYFIWSIGSIGLGIITYRVSEHKLPLAIIVTAVLFGAGAFVGLIWLAGIAIFLLVALGFVFFGERRN